ncbi:MAG TPA: ribosomal L7Ae/L30e/S12e/Gadd45 family protein [Candidatus Nanoarchaeia archaeon]|nr:ribosomal L7Ae/L30e/S12e/Gadd45 family protein [Candidatus Nanoarchaeia archaeon]
MTDFNQLINSGKAIIGTERTLKELKLGKLAKVYVTNNCPPDLKENVQRQAMLAKTEIEQLEIPNQELGTLCKKPFSISLLGQLR